MYSENTDSVDGDKKIELRSPYRSNAPDNSASPSEKPRVFETTKSFSPGNSQKADEYKKSGRGEGLSIMEKAALEFSMKKHNRAFDLLASD